jgi:uncharacterized protein (TIGR03437 family)
MRIPAVPCAVLVCASALLGQSGTEVGAGAPNDYIRSLFVNAYNRGRFASIAGAPSAGVRRFGATGLIQEFQGTGGARAALVRSTTLSDPDNSLADVFQIHPEIFTYFSSVGVATAGYPLNDTLSCPGSPCRYQLFSFNHALFAWPAGTNDVENITVKDPFYSRWLLHGGAVVLGAPTSAEEDIASSFGSNARKQSFTSGALYNITSGQLTGRFISVRPPIAALYFAERAHSGRLGLPATEEMILPNGRKRQTFEGGSIEYEGDGAPVVRTPVQSVTLRPAITPVRLNLGETLTLQAVPVSTEGEELTDRPVAFATTNGRVIALQGTGQTITVRAVGGGTANVTATVEGKISAPVVFIVSAPCCQIGEGAPTGVIQQAMQDAALRNRLSLRLPGPERVRRAGAGYVQEFQSNDAAATRYLIAISDRSAKAYAISGATLNRYETLGGPSASLGYPISDVTPAGRQMFEGGALAGAPVRVVSGATLAKWALLSYEDGPAGLPASEAVRASSFTASQGFTQAFRGGVILSGPRGAFYVGGVVLARYIASGSAAGSLGFPTGDETPISGKRRQEFEGGSIEYAPGDTEATVTQRERKPAVSVNPASVVPGSRVRLTVSGFANGSTLRIKPGADPEFLVRTAAGSYSWETYVPAAAIAGAVRVTAADSANTAVAAEATYIVRSMTEVRARLVRVSGDTQTGAPAVVLPSPLRVLLQDDAGNALAGVMVRFTPSPGAEVTPVSAETDLNGFAETRLRMPPVEGVALVNAEAARQVTTFSARSASSSLSGFPKLMPAGSETVGHGTRTIADAGALLAASASMIRHLQTRGDVPSPNGPAAVASLNQYLKTACTTDYQGVQYCDGFITPPESDEQIVNLWRLPAFAGNGFEVQVDRAELSIAREAIARGLPALLPLSMQRNGAPAGVHYVVATGLNTDSSLQVHDPKFGRQHLNDFINGFSVSQDASQDKWTGAVIGVVRFIPGTPRAESFLVTSGSEGISIGSLAGACGQTLELADRAAGEGAPARSVSIFRLRWCDGAAGDYQIEVSGRGAARAVVTDLSEGGSRIELAGSSAAAFRAWRPAAWLVVAPQQTAIATRGIVNAATFSAGIAPGSLIAIFGTGLSRAGAASSVQIGGRPALVVSGTPFQLNAVVPTDVPPGTHMLRIETPYGPAEEPVDIQQVAPAFFSISAGRPALVNQDGTLNSPATPARRGTVLVMYLTGLGVFQTNSGFPVTQVPVSASIFGQEMPVFYAGAAPGFPGLYQVNVGIPASTPIGAAVPLLLSQAGLEIQPVEVAIQ